MPSVISIVPLTSNLFVTSREPPVIVISEASEVVVTLPALISPSIVIVEFSIDSFTSSVPPPIELPDTLPDFTLPLTVIEALSIAPVFVMLVAPVIDPFLIVPLFSIAPLILISEPSIFAFVSLFSETIPLYKVLP